MVIAADRPPSDLESLDDRVRSRLAGGLVVEMGPLGEELRLEILKTPRRRGARASSELRRAGRRCWPIIAKSITHNGRDLEGALNRLLAHSKLTGQPVTLEMAEREVRDLIRPQEPKRVKIEDIQRVVARQYNVSRSDLLSSRRTANVVRPRQVAMYLAKTLTLRSLPEIGRRFGGRDHTTVLHAVRKIEDLVGNDTALADEIEVAEAAAAGIARPAAPRCGEPRSQSGAGQSRRNRGDRRSAVALAESRCPARHLAVPRGDHVAGASHAGGLPSSSRAPFAHPSGYRMKVTVERAQLLKSLGHVHRVVERRNTIPILANVLIARRKRQAVAEGDRPRPRGDRDASRPRSRRAARPPCRRTCSTTSCASCRTARRSCWKPPATARVLAIRAGRSRFTLQTLPESDFPDLAAGDMTHTLHARRPPTSSG